MASIEAATEKITVTLPDGTPLELPAGATGADAAAAIGPGLAKAALAIRVDGELRDLAAQLPDGAEMAILTDRDPEALELIRHDAAHVMAEAVHGALPGHQGDDRAGDRGRLLLRLRVPRRGEDHRGRPASRSRRRCAAHIEADEEFSRRDRPGRRGDRDLQAAGRELQGRADRGPGPRRRRRDASRSTATAPSRISAAARTAPRPGGSRRSS